MAFPPLLLLLLAGGAALVASGGKRGGTTFSRAGGLQAGMPQAPGGLEPPWFSSFASGSGGEYPVPYRYSDALKISSMVMSWLNEITGAKTRPHYDMLKARFDAITGSSLPKAAKTYALVMTVVVPAICGASLLLYNWYQPPSAQKKKLFTATCVWAFMFSALPQTATADAIIRDPNVYLGTGSALLDDMNDYLHPQGKVVVGLTPFEIRMLLNDIAWYQINWIDNNFPSPDPDSVVNQMRRAGEQRMDEWYAAFPATGGEQVIVEGNFELLQIMLWFAKLNAETVLTGIDFDEAAAWAMLVVKVVATVGAGLSGFAGPAIAAAINSGIAAMQALAKAYAAGEVTRDDMQALGGAAVALALKEAGIDLDIGKPLEQLEQLINT